MGETGRVLLLFFLGIITFCNFLTWSVLTQRLSSTSAATDKAKVKGIGFAVRVSLRPTEQALLIQPDYSRIAGRGHRQESPDSPRDPAADVAITEKDKNTTAAEASPTPATTQKDEKGEEEDHHDKKKKQNHKGNHGKKPAHDKQKKQKGPTSKKVKHQHKEEQDHPVSQQPHHGSGSTEKQQQQPHDVQPSNDPIVQDKSDSAGSEKGASHESVGRASKSDEGGGVKEKPSDSGKKDSAPPTADGTKPRVVLFTDYGNITLELEPQAAPKTVANFLKNVHTGYLNRTNGACFYRYERGFVLQGGCCSGNSGATVPLEYNLPNIKNSVAMARTSDPDSGGSEFFINLRDNSESLGPRKKGGYAVFAHVVGGFETIAELKKLPTKGGKGKLTTYLKRPKINYVEIL